MAGGYITQGGQGGGHDTESDLTSRNQPVRSRKKSIKEKGKAGLKASGWKLKVRSRENRKTV